MKRIFWLLPAIFWVSISFAVPKASFTVSLIKIPQGRLWILQMSANIAMQGTKDDHRT